VIATVAKLLEHQGQSALSDLLTNAHARIEAMGSDFGVMYYTAFLEVPVGLFATVEPTLSDLESSLLAKFQSVLRYPHDVVSQVVVSATLEEPMSSVRRRELAAADALRLWEPKTFRLFLSHVSAHKVAVSSLKASLRKLGVSAFVAHADIEPAAEWLEEIDRALRSMQAMAALLTVDFHESKWTDQEVGVAIARGVSIVPVSLGLMPYGFIAKQQALFGDLTQPDKLALEIVAALEKQRATGAPIREALVLALEVAGSFADARDVTTAVEASSGFTAVQLRRIEESVVSNSQVSGSFYVPARLQRYVAVHAPAGGGSQ
jgi:hypothetical protein